MIVLSVDAESNGLHGPVFAVAGCIVGPDGDPWPLHDFAARCPVPEPVDPWVAEHVLPALAGLPVTHATPRELRDAFWSWLQAHKGGCVVVADCGWPVEAGLLSACVADDPSRAFAGPYPLHEVATLLLAAGMDPLGTYDSLCPACPWPKHDPRRDALQSAACALEALRRLTAERDAADAQCRAWKEKLAAALRAVGDEAGAAAVEAALRGGAP